jgi:hypothetical protein
VARIKRDGLDHGIGHPIRPRFRRIGSISQLDKEFGGAGCHPKGPKVAGAVIETSETTWEDAKVKYKKLAKAGI